MSYDCVVLIKQVPDTKAVTGRAMNDDGTVNRAVLPAIFNPEDLNALELALQIRQDHGGTVTVITMGLPRACDVLRDSLYRGADRAILITDRRAAASDTLATSYILSCAVNKLIHEPDRISSEGSHPQDRKTGSCSQLTTHNSQLSSSYIVLCGRQAIDGDTAQVGPQAAEKLGIPQLTYVEELLELKDGRITVRRSIGSGWEKVRAELPVLLTVMDSANTPRPAGAKRIMKYKKARSPSELKKDDDAEEKIAKLRKKGLLIEEWNLDDIEADLTWCGRSGSPTKVNRIQSVILTAGEYKKIEPTDNDLHKLVHELIEDHTIG